MYGWSLKNVASDHHVARIKVFKFRALLATLFPSTDSELAGYSKDLQSVSSHLQTGHHSFWHNYFAQPGKTVSKVEPC